MNMDMKRKIRIVLWSAAAALAFAGCGSKESAGSLQSGEESVAQVRGQEESSAADSLGSAGDSAVSGMTKEPSQSDLPVNIPAGQITEQSFEVALDGWGEVTFASFEPEQYSFQKNGVWMYGDARFMLIKEGKVVYIFPAVYEDNEMAGWQFGQVASVSFRDYNEDGRPDILLLLEYEGVQGIDIGEKWMEARVFTQKNGEAEFHLDNTVTNYINRNAGAAGLRTMKEADQILAEYAKQYSMVTDISAWEVERFAESVRQDILSGDFEELSQKINFPITIDGNVYSGKEAFLSTDFVKNPSRVFLEAIEQSVAANLFCNWQGIMLGNGEVWFAEVSGAGSDISQGLRIIAVNGISEGQQSSQAALADSWQQEAALSERMEYYSASVYCHDIVNYWENVRGVTDISNCTDFLFATDSCYYTAEDFKEEPSLVIHLAKNEIYARHGYIFEDPDLYNYFMGCIWYEPTTAPKDFEVSVLNEYERENVKVLAELDDF